MDGNLACESSVTGPSNAEWDEILARSEDAVLAYQQLITQAAQALGHEFRTQREAEYRRAAAALAGHRDKLRSLWSPLQFRVRIREGSVTLGWQLVFANGPRDRGQKTFEPIPTLKGGPDYDPFRLYQVAREHERELVVATERRAAAIRKAWAVALAMRSAHRTLTTSRTTLTNARSTDPT